MMNCAGSFVVVETVLMSLLSIWTILHQQPLVLTLERLTLALQFGKSFGKSLEKKSPDAAAVSGLWRFSHPPFAQGESSLRYPIGPKAVGIRGRIISESGFGLRCTGFPNG